MTARPLHILLVEDNPGDVRLTREALREAEGFLFTYTHAASIACSLERLFSEEFDIALVDLSLPDSQGLNGPEQIMNAFPELPVVILTGLDDEAVGVNAVQAGAQDYLIKGQSDGKLMVRVIRYSIERKQAEIEREKMLKELQDLFQQVKTLRGLLPMCAWCKKIRDDNGEWVMLETFIGQHSNADVTHGICPECTEKHLRKH
ncbi:MAG: response regulator [Ignavibacteriales bacterium]|nr:response regulator [Ignavibacteriales bacterium]